MKYILISIFLCLFVSAKSEASGPSIYCLGSYFSDKEKMFKNFDIKILSPAEIESMSMELLKLPRSEREERKAQMLKDHKVEFENYKVSYESVTSCDNDGDHCRSLLNLKMIIGVPGKSKMQEIVSFQQLERMFSSERFTEHTFNLGFAPYDLSLRCQLR